MTKAKQTRKTIAKRTIRERLVEPDSRYLLKLVIVVIFGSLWLKFKAPIEWMGWVIGAFPIGLLLGIVGVRFLEPNQSDRKIWYAVLVIVAVVAVFMPVGIFL